MARVFYVLILSLFIGLCSAQDQEAAVREMFDDPGTVTSVRHFKGEFNSVHPFEIWIGNDGRSYRGMMHMNSGELQFDLIGGIENDKLVLQEIDDRGQITGYLRGELLRDRYLGRWWSSDLGRSAEFRLLEDGLILLEEFEPRMVQYEGLVGEQKVELCLWYEAPELVSGVVVTDTLCTRVFGGCKNEFCREVTLEVTSGPYDNVSLTATSSEHKMKLVARDAEGAKTGVMEVVNEFAIHRGGELDFVFIADYSYPLITDGGFADWIEARMAEWYAQYQNRSSKAEATVDARWIDFASAWVDVFMIEDGMVSGLITSTDPGSGLYHREAFTYDLDENRIIEIEELTRKDVDLEEFLQGKLEVTNAEEYLYPVLTGPGFVMCTGFDAIRGDSLHLVPYVAVEEVLRKRSMFTKLAD